MEKAGGDDKVEAPFRVGLAQGAGDGEAWIELVHGWDRIRDPLLDALFTGLIASRPWGQPGADGGRISYGPGAEVRSTNG